MTKLLSLFWSISVSTDEDWRKGWRRCCIHCNCPFFHFTDIKLVFLLWVFSNPFAGSAPFSISLISNSFFSTECFQIHLQDLSLFPCHWYQIVFLYWVLLNPFAGSVPISSSSSQLQPLQAARIEAGTVFLKGNQNDGQAPPTFQDFYSSLSRRITRTCSWELSEGLFWQFVGNCKIFAQNNSIGFVDDWFWHFSLDWILGFESLNWIGIFLSLISIQVLIYLDSCASCSS